MLLIFLCVCFFFFKQKTAYEMRISDWSSDVCSSDLATIGRIRTVGPGDMYSGALARNFVDGVRDAGGWLTADDMRNLRPVWRSTIERKIGRAACRERVCQYV